MLAWLKKVIQGEDKPIDTLGARGENAAAKYLRELGYRIIIRNFKIEAGEVDIIARDEKTLVFVEVKTRTSADQVSPEDQVDDEKRKQVARVARIYMSRYGTPQPPYRFDVVAIIWPTGREPQIRHIPSAFQVD